MGHIKDRWYTGRGDTKKSTARHGNGLRWQVKYQMDGQERDGGSFARKVDAERKLTDLEGQKLKGRWVDPNNQMTVTELCWQYASMRIHKPNTAKRVGQSIRTHVEATPLGKQRVVAVRHSAAQAWVSDRGRLLAPRTLQLLVGMMRSAFESALYDHLIGENPFARVRGPAVEKKKVVPLTVEQVRALAETVRPQYRAMVITQAGLGLRLGELLGLRVQDVDFLRREVRVVSQLDRDTRELVELKTAASRRTVPLPDVVAVALAEHIKRHHSPNPAGLLFTTGLGTPYTHSGYQVPFKLAVTKLQGGGVSLPPEVSPHDLRHHYASVLLFAGESVIAVAERLGHEDGSLVLSTYGHLMPDSEGRTRKAVDAAWAVDDPSGVPTTSRAILK